MTNDLEAKLRPVAPQEVTPADPHPSFPEAERRAWTEECVRMVTNTFADVLPPAELTERIQAVRQMRYYLSGAELPSDPHIQIVAEAAGLIMVRVERDGNSYTVDRQAAVRLTDELSVAQLKQSALHEAIHLMSPPSHVVVGGIIGPEVVEYTGAFSYYRDLDTGEVDPHDYWDNAKARQLFWEASTDWLANEELRTNPTITEADMQDIDASIHGYIERYYIEYLFKKISQRAEAITALKRAMVEGSEDVFYNTLGRLLSTAGVEFYNELIGVLKMPMRDAITAEARADAWMSAVDRQCQS